MSTKPSRIERLMPAFMQRAAETSGPLATLFDVMDVLPLHSEALYAEIDRFFDPRRTEERFVPYLAAWVDLRRVYEVSSAFQPRRKTPVISRGAMGGSLRELVAAAASLSQWRGTKRGLVGFLEIATGLRGFVIEASASDRPFHVRILAPPGALHQHPLIARIVALEKPVHVTCEVVWAAGEAPAPSAREASRP